MARPSPHPRGDALGRRLVEIGGVGQRQIEHQRAAVAVVERRLIVGPIESCATQRQARQADVEAEQRAAQVPGLAVARGLDGRSARASRRGLRRVISRTP